MNMEAYLGFNTFNTQKQTGQRRIDFVKYRQLIAEGHTFDDDLAEQVIPKPKA
jgi:6-oxo-cyclohex-1-ene-carbonyl-CoA hydrolase